VLVQDVIRRLKSLGAGRVRELEGITENVTFPLPKSILAPPGDAA
jgi:4-hydroxy-3-methylbut-2-enyl diphosphate reductase